MTHHRITIWIVRLFLIVAVVTAGYLTWQSLTSGRVAGCDEVGQLECGDVLNSRWSMWLGIPVALVGGMAYAAALITSFLHHRFRWIFQFFVSLAAMAAIYFIGIQGLVLQAFCKYCMIVHGCGCTAGLLLLADHFLSRQALAPLLPPQPGAPAISPGLFLPAPIPDKVHVGPGTSFQRCAVVLLVQMLLFGVLAVGQWLGPYESHTVSQFKGQLTLAPAVGDDSPTADNGTLGALTTDDQGAPASEGEHASAAERGELQEQRTSLLYPILGNPQASRQVVEFADYTCKHCRKAHDRMKTLLARYGDQLAVVVRPIAMEKQCNPRVKKDTPQNFNSCKYARYALAVWKLAPESFADFHEWVSTGEKPPGISDTWSRASKIVDSELLLEQVNGPDVTNRLSANHLLWEQNPGAIPMLVVGQEVLHGLPKTDDELFEIVEKAFPDLVRRSP